MSSKVRLTSSRMMKHDIGSLSWRDHPSAKWIRHRAKRNGSWTRLTWWALIRL